MRRVVENPCIAWDVTCGTKRKPFLYLVPKMAQITYCTVFFLRRLMGESIAIDGEGVKPIEDEGVNEGVKALLSAIRDSPGKRANELAVLIGKGVKSVERQVKTLRDSGKIEFRGAPKNGGYFVKKA